MMNFAEQDIERAREYLVSNSSINGRMLQSIKPLDLRLLVAACRLYESQSSYGVLQGSLTSCVAAVFGRYPAALYDVLRQGWINLELIQSLSVGKVDLWVMTPNEPLCELLNVKPQVSARIKAGLKRLQEQAEQPNMLQIAESAAELMKTLGLDGARRAFLLGLDSIPDIRL